MAADVTAGTVATTNVVTLQSAKYPTMLAAISPTEIMADWSGPQKLRRDLCDISDVYTAIGEN